MWRELYNDEKKTLIKVEIFYKNRKRDKNNEWKNYYKLHEIHSPRIRVEEKYE